jgi:hypothetical protein
LQRFDVHPLDAPSTRPLVNALTTVLARGLLCVAAILPAVPLQGQTPATEYALKAAFLYHVPQFITWPATMLDDSSALSICVARPNPFGGTLEELTAGDAVGGRALQVREVARTADLDGCHVLFVSTAAGARGQTLLARAARLPIVSVGESPDFLDEGGLINLRVDDRRLRFEVDIIGARERGLDFSSQLLRLADGVRQEAP